MTITYKQHIPNIEDYFSLFESTGWNEEYKLTKEELSTTLDKSYYCISAYDGEKLIGFGRMMSDGILHAMIYEMIVYPVCQGRGIGREILNRLLAKCIENNIRDIQLFCAKGKRRFYEKSGFVARPDDGPGMDYRKQKD
jgi:GNAT superfamily N-acetyltransferase